MAEEVIKEGTWKCPNCGGRNRGRDVECPGCGQAREGVSFEYDESAAQVTDTAELAVARGGADWVCGYCATSNRAGRTKCRQCSAERAEGVRRQEKDVAPRVTPLPPPSAGLGIPGWLKGLAAVLVALFVMLGWLGSCERPRTVKVVQLAWERTVEVERQVPVKEEGWSLPAGARELDRRQAIHHHVDVPIGVRPVTRTDHEKVKVGTRKQKTGVKDMGNGYFKEIYEDVPIYETRAVRRTVQETIYRKDPVYQTRYTYELMKWKTQRTERASGADPAPRWPELNLPPGDREGKRIEKYLCVLEDGKTGKRHEMDPDAGTFVTLALGETRTAIFNGLGGLVRLEGPMAGR